jgi:hypothetical protein
LFLDRLPRDIHHALYVAAREQAGHEASPTAAIIDSQTVLETLAQAAQKEGRMPPQAVDAAPIYCELANAFKQHSVN